MIAFSRMSDDYFLDAWLFGLPGVSANTYLLMSFALFFSQNYITRCGCSVKNQSFHRSSFSVLILIYCANVLGVYVLVYALDVSWQSMIGARAVIFHRMLRLLHWTRTGRVRNRACLSRCFFFGEILQVIILSAMYM